jgi:hypothetical protein
VEREERTPIEKLKSNAQKVDARLCQNPFALRFIPLKLHYFIVSTLVPTVKAESGRPQPAIRCFHEQA